MKQLEKNLDLVLETNLCLLLESNEAKKIIITPLSKEVNFTEVEVRTKFDKYIIGDLGNENFEKIIVKHFTWNNKKPVASILITSLISLILKMKEADCISYIGIYKIDMIERGVEIVFKNEENVFAYYDDIDNEDELENSIDTARDVINLIKNNYYKRPEIK